MRNNVSEETEELLFKLGYDDREDHFYGNGKKMMKLMRETRKEQLRETQEYIEYLDDCSDDYFINMKNVKIERIM